MTRLSKEDKDHLKAHLKSHWSSYKSIKNHRKDCFLCESISTYLQLAWMIDQKIEVDEFEDLPDNVKLSEDHLWKLHLSAFHGQQAQTGSIEGKLDRTRKKGQSKKNIEAQPDLDSKTGAAFLGKAYDSECMQIYSEIRIFKNIVRQSKGSIGFRLLKAVQEEDYGFFEKMASFLKAVHETSEPLHNMEYEAIAYANSEERKRSLGVRASAITNAEIKQHLLDQGFEVEDGNWSRISKFIKPIVERIKSGPKAERQAAS